MVELDIIIPVYNESSNIITVLESFRRSVRTPFRVFICYDQEEDNTLPPLREYKNSPFDIVLVKNQGVGAHGAVVSGFRASSAPAVLVFPADDTYNAGIIDTLYQKFKDPCDIVVASRFIKGGKMVGCRWLKQVLVRLSSFTLYYMARLPVRDATNGFRLFSRRLLNTITIESTMGFAFSLELLVKCHRLGWKIGEVPALWHERKGGSSRFRIAQWIPVYLRWYFFAFETTYCGKRP